MSEGHRKQLRVSLSFGTFLSLYLANKEKEKFILKDILLFVTFLYRQESYAKKLATGTTFANQLYSST